MVMSPQKGLGQFVRKFAIFMIIELIILFLLFVLTGTFTTNNTPLPFISAVATSIGTTVWDMGIAFFIVGSALNLILMFLLY